jgi:hypothetical protein
MGKRGSIRVSPARRTHILDGDATGGGHGPGRQTPKRSEFPGHLTDDDIIDGAEAIANDPKSYPSGSVPTGGKVVVIEGQIKGVKTRVVVDPQKHDVVTAYPLGVPRNR